MSRHVPLFFARLVTLFLALAGAAVGVVSAFHAKNESAKTKGGAQAAVDKLNMGVTVTIDTNDVFVAGEVEGIAQLGIALLSALLILLILLDGRKRHAVPNAPNVRVPPFSSRTLILQWLALAGASVFALATAAVTTKLVFTREAKVISKFANGTVVPPALVAKLSSGLGISPVYKDQDYLVFLAIAPWFGFFFSFVAAIVTFMAWRRYQNAQRDTPDSAYNSTDKF